VIIKRKNSPVGIVLNLFDNPDNMATTNCVAELAHDESNKHWVRVEFSTRQKLYIIIFKEIFFTRLLSADENE